MKRLFDLKRLTEKNLPWASVQAFFRLVLLFVLILIATACQLSESTSIVEMESSNAGEILIYTAIQESQIESYLGLFNEEYPEIKVNVLRESTGLLTDRLFAEANDPQADVIWNVAATSLMIAEWEYMLQSYTPEGLERVETRFYNYNKPPHWVGTNLWMSAFCVNTDKLKELNLPVPQSWTDLIDPIYADQITMPNPSFSGTSLLTLAGIFQLYGSIEGWEYLDQLDQNIGQYTNSGAKPCQLADTGEYAIGISSGIVGTRLESESKSIEVIFPQEGSGWDMDASALVKKKNIKPAAKTFLDWLISDNAMQKYAEEFAVTAVQTGQPVPKGYPANPRAQTIDSSLPWVAANRQSILAEWQRRYGKK